MAVKVLGIGYQTVTRGYSPTRTPAQRFPSSLQSNPCQKSKNIGMEPKYDLQEPFRLLEY